MINPAEPDVVAARALPCPREDWCLFLDVDGTLLELAQTPDRVVVDEHLLPLLERLRIAADGAVALVSGRTIADVDGLLGTEQFAVAGVHGSQRRDVHGHVQVAAVDTAPLTQLRESLETLVAGNPNLLLEDKGAGLAVHFATAPELRQGLRREVAQLTQSLTEFVVADGRAVIEIRPAGHTKGSAVIAYLRQEPFANRLPIFIGDDITDRDGFAAVQRYDGIAIAVGPRVRSQWWLPGPAAVRMWLQRLLWPS